VRADDPSPSDLPFEVLLAPDAAPGDFVPPLARLLLALARRKLVAKSKTEVTEEGQKPKV
jgi:hypothetical protein